MELWPVLFAALDAVLIAPYRVFAVPIVGFFFGTFVLCAWCVLFGEMTFRLVSAVNGRHVNALRAQAVRMHNLSVKAIVIKDKESYRSCNKEANEAFGKYFFNMVTHGAAYLWPVPFALAWMATRFSRVEFELLFSLPFFGDTVGFAAVPIPMYILARILWNKVKPYLYFFNRDPRVGLDQGEVEMIKWEELHEHKGLPEKFWTEQRLPDLGDGLTAKK
ncbi:hypothetical protein [Desulfobulbus alkaliphilus]|uniref:hypothetical protein n=1 Tax=Desulfobulbus alkaliphilus TaxID=869814 RepID=UPI00196233FB|nr:hypothetical protein [Desulfobulbus alkaliphilus]MBM9535767.1 hypothetical protein [Desulfobulbus alkaliphilus]